MFKKTIPALLIAIATITLLVVSCKKEDTQKPDDNPTGTTVSSKDPVSLSAALKVWHGTRVTGNAPTPTGNIPEIDATVNPSVVALSGRYAIIKPEVTDGEVAGYYVAVAKAGQYFKVDFTKPRDIAGRGLKRNHQNILQRPQGGNADSAIVITLPANINVPDTFCVTYYPYDDFGNIGQPVTTCIYVGSLGAPDSEGWLKNDFRVTSTWDLRNGIREDWDTTIYNRWVPSSNSYHCVQVQGYSFLQYIGPGGNETPIVHDSSFISKENIRFAINGAFDYSDNYLSKEVDVDSSTCNQFVFKPTVNDIFSLTGAYNYNPITKKLILIYEFDEYGLPDTAYDEYEVMKISNTHILLKGFEDYYVRLER